MAIVTLEPLMGFTPIDRLSSRDADRAMKCIFDDRPKFHNSCHLWSLARLFPNWWGSHSFIKPNTMWIFYLNPLNHDILVKGHEDLQYGFDRILKLNLITWIKAIEIEVPHPSHLETMFVKAL